MEINEAVLDEALTYLFARNASRLRFLQYACWRRTLKWHFQEATDEEIRTIFTRLKRRGHFIAKKLAPRTHASYLFTQTSTSQLTEEEINARIERALHVSSVVSFGF